jgi:hypothetical protein
LIQQNKPTFSGLSVLFTKQKGMKNMYVFGEQLTSSRILSESPPFKPLSINLLEEKFLEEPTPRYRYWRV